MCVQALPRFYEFRSRPRHEIVDDALGAGLIEIDGKFVASHRAYPAIAEFLVKHAVAARVGGGMRIGRLHHMRLGFDQRWARALRAGGTVCLCTLPARTLVGARETRVGRVVAETHIAAVE